MEFAKFGSWLHWSSRMSLTSRVISSRLLLLVTVMTLLADLSGHQRWKVEGHGRLLDPPSRASMWRFGFDSAANYDDNQGYCGGRSQLWSRFQGKCGVCGDPWEPRPRAHERGGRYYDGTPVRTYQQGDVITVVVGITANHRGWMEFRLCPYDRPKSDDVEYDDDGDFVEVSQSCLDKHLLEMADGSGTRFDLPEPYRVGEYSVDVRLPPAVSCKKCLLQWKWNVANSWGTDKDGTSCVGCGEQEQFYACSDVVIESNGWDGGDDYSHDDNDDWDDYDLYPSHPGGNDHRPPATLPSPVGPRYPVTQTYPPPPVYTDYPFTFDPWNGVGKGDYPNGFFPVTRGSYPEDFPVDRGDYPRRYPVTTGGFPWSRRRDEDDRGFTPVWRKPDSVYPDGWRTVALPVTTTTTTTVTTARPTTATTIPTMHPNLPQSTSAPNARKNPHQKGHVTVPTPRDSGNPKSNNGDVDEDKSRRPNKWDGLLPRPKTRNTWYKTPQTKTGGNFPKKDGSTTSTGQPTVPSFWKWLLHSHPLQQKSTVFPVPSAAVDWTTSSISTTSSSEIGWVRKEAQGSKEPPSWSWWQKLLRLSKKTTWDWPRMNSNNAGKTASQSQSSLQRHHRVRKSSTTSTTTTTTTTTTKPPTTTTTTTTTASPTTTSSAASTKSIIDQESTADDATDTEGQSDSQRFSRILSIVERLKKIFFPLQKSTPTTKLSTTTEKPDRVIGVKKKVDKVKLMNARDSVQKQFSRKKEFYNTKSGSASADVFIPWLFPKNERVGPEFFLNSWHNREMQAPEDLSRKDSERILGEKLLPHSVNIVAYSGIVAPVQSLNLQNETTKSDELSKTHNQRVEAGASRKRFGKKSITHPAVSHDRSNQITAAAAASRSQSDPISAAASRDDRHIGVNVKVPSNRKQSWSSAAADERQASRGVLPAANERESGTVVGVFDNNFLATMDQELLPSLTQEMETFQDYRSFDNAPDSEPSLDSVPNNGLIWNIQQQSPVQIAEDIGYQQQQRPFVLVPPAEHRIIHNQRQAQQNPILPTQYTIQQQQQQQYEQQHNSFVPTEHILQRQQQQQQQQLQLQRQQHDSLAPTEYITQRNLFIPTEIVRNQQLLQQQLLQQQQQQQQQQRRRNPSVSTQNRGYGSLSVEGAEGTASPPYAQELLCSPVGQWVQYRPMWRWCQYYCRQGYCPSSHCSCV